MLHNQFEDDLTHLEQIVPFLAAGSPLGLSYWRRRVTSLSAHQRLIPDGKTRVTRLLLLFDSIEQFPPGESHGVIDPLLPPEPAYVENWCIAPLYFACHHGAPVSVLPMPLTRYPSMSGEAVH